MVLQPAVVPAGQHHAPLLHSCQHRACYLPPHQHSNALQVVCGSMGMPTATVRMKGPDGISRIASGIGAGPVDAAYKVRRGLGMGCSGRGGVQWGRGWKSQQAGSSGVERPPAKPLPPPPCSPPYSTLLLPPHTTCSTHPTLQAIDSLVRVQAELVDYSVNSVTGAAR